MLKRGVLYLVLFGLLVVCMPLDGFADMLRLGGVQFDPLTEQSFEGPRISSVEEEYEALSVVPDNSVVDDNYAIVQFDGPVQDGWRESLASAGATVLDYVPDYAFIVRLPKNQWEGLRDLGHVRWVGAYATGYRISGEAKAASVFGLEDVQNDFGLVPLSVAAFPGESAEIISAWIFNLGGNVSEIFQSSWGIKLKASLPADNVAEVAEIPGVKWVEIRHTARVRNNKAVGIVGAAPYHAGAFTDLYGAGQVVAVCDGGLDKGSTTDINVDFLDGYGASRVLNIFRWGDYSSSRDVDGHGTHVAGSVLGNGQNSGANPAINSFPSTSFAGLAPKAKLVFQAVGNPLESTSSLPGLPVDLKPLFQQALDASAQIHSNSWGSPGTGGYDGECADVDQFCWDHRNFLILYAGGNAGRDYNLDGVIDRYNLDTPATAKNCLSIGATESLRASGGYAERTWGSFISCGEPISSDLTSNHIMGMAAFSSRGPCADGRTKPDIVAPGTNIVSTRSSVQEGNGWGAYDNHYYFAGGTSMSTPISAGTAALLREYLTTRTSTFAGGAPSSAMLKACLVNAAVDIAPGQYGTGAQQEITETPGPVAGWGRINLAGAVYPEAPYFINYYDNTAGLTTNQQATYTVGSVSNEKPLRITLAWTDYPSTEAANGGLVNDLDLMVSDRNGHVYYPDNAKMQTAMEEVLYYSTSSRLTEQNVQQVALRMTPSSYPKHLTSLHWGGSNKNTMAGTVTVEIFSADASGHPTGTALFSEKLQNWKNGEFALPVNIDVVSGDVVAVFTFSDPADMGLYASEGNTGGRALVGDGNGGWQLASFTPAIIGVFFSANASENFDRVNNLVGVTIDNPSGDYTVTVNGYNVPRGPQPFALVVSGTNGEVPENLFEAVPGQPNAPSYGSISQNFTSMSAARIQSTYNLSLNAVYGNVGGYTAAITGGSGLVAMRHAVTFDAAQSVSSLQLYKLYDNGIDARPFTYSDLGEFADGNWWLSKVDGTRLDSGGSVEAGKAYYVNSVVQDNGPFDRDGTGDIVSDPQVLGSSGATPTPTPSPDSGGGSGGGCTVGANSAVMPWLLVALAACVLALRIGSGKRREP